MIIVDGPDNIGKTTFIKKLAAELRFSIRGFGQEIQEWKFEKIVESLQLESALKDQDYSEDMDQWDCNIDDISAADIIYDRYHMSCFVYGKVIRKSDLITAYDCKLLNLHLNAAKLAYTVLILPCDIEEYEKNLQRSAQAQDFDREQNIAVAECFKLHAEYFGVNEIIHIQSYPKDYHIKKILRSYKSWRYGDETEASKKNEADMAETEQSYTEDTSATAKARILNDRNSKDLTHG